MMAGRLRLGSPKVWLTFMHVCRSFTFLRARTCKWLEICFRVLDLPVLSLMYLAINSLRPRRKDMGLGRHEASTSKTLERAKDRNGPYFKCMLDVFHFPFGHNLDVTGDLFSGAWFASPQLDVPSYQLIATWNETKNQVSNPKLNFFRFYPSEQCQNSQSEQNVSKPLQCPGLTARCLHTILSKQMSLYDKIAIDYYQLH